MIYVYIIKNTSKQSLAEALRNYFNFLTPEELEKHE